MVDRPTNTIVGTIKNGFLARMMNFSPPAVVVWLALANRADKSSRCHPSISTLISDTGLARSSIYKAIDELVEADEINVTPGGGKGNPSNQYTIKGSPRNGLAQTANQSKLRTKVVQSTDMVVRIADKGSPPFGHKPDTRTRRMNQTHEPDAEIKRGCAAEVVFPSELSSEQFREAWNRWTAHRKELHKPLTPSTIKAQLKKLAAWGTARAVAAIDRSIEAGWTGIFEEQKNGNGKPANNYAAGPGQRYDPAHKNNVPIVGGF
jgi:hypothetical protein